MNKTNKIIISALLAVLLFRFGYWICDFFNLNGSQDWWRMRQSIYSIIFALVFYIGYNCTTGYARKIIIVGVVYCLFDVVDRYLFNINEYNMNDVLLDVFAFCLLIINPFYARKIKRIAR